MNIINYNEILIVIKNKMYFLVQCIIYIILSKYTYLNGFYKQFYDYCLSNILIKILLFILSNESTEIYCVLKVN